MGILFNKIHSLIFCSYALQAFLCLSVSSAMTCQDVFYKRDVVAETLSQVTAISRLCQDGACSINISKVINYLRGEIPGLKLTDFKVIYIATPAWALDQSTSQAFYVKGSRGGLVPGELLPLGVSYSHHVVLEYRGRIYDPDFYVGMFRSVDKAKYYKYYFAGPGPLRMKPADLEIMENQNVEGKIVEVGSIRDKLLLYEIPLDYYMAYPPDYMGTKRAHREMLDAFTPSLMRDYMLSH